MDLDGALTVFGLTEDATPVDVGETYRRLRKPLLKELNKFDDAEQPPDLVEQLDKVDTAYKILVEEIKPPAPEQTQRTGGTGTGTGAKRTTGRVSFARGDVLAGRYELEALIAHRPEGDTYRVKDQVRGVRLGLKVIAPQLMADPRRRKTVLRGLLAASRMNHPNLARVLDIHPLQQTYAVTLQIPEDAENLWDLMYGAEGSNRDKLTKELVLKMTEQATKALAELHKAAPHAVLRPESVWVRPDGTVKIADFGFGDLQQALRERRLSRTKLGTAYWAPEQYRDDAAVDGRSDQYSFGVILYEILSGKPLVGRTEKIRSFRKDYPQRFTDALERALASKRARRFETMNEFGQAAFAGFRADDAPPVMSRESMLIPTLVLLALFIGFAMSPLGRQAADLIGSAVRGWDADELRVVDADRDLRRLRDMAGGLKNRQQQLDETSREELAKIRNALVEEELDGEGRAELNDRLAEIVRKLVADSYRRAENSMGAMVAAEEPLEQLGYDEARTKQALIDGIKRDFDPEAPLDERAGQVIELARRVAALDRGMTGWRAERAAVRGMPERGKALRALLEAEAALAIGDDEATGAAYGAAADALDAIASAATNALEDGPSFEPPDADAIPFKPLKDETPQVLDDLLEPASRITKDGELEVLLDELRKEGLDAADAEWLVHNEGYWAFKATVGVRTFLAGGIWSGEGKDRRMRVLAFGKGLLETPYDVEATKGADRPGLGDLRAVLSTGPRDASAWWSTSGDRPLPATSFTPDQRTVKERDPLVSGTVAGGQPSCVLVDAKRFEVKDGKFAAKLRVSGDVLATWARAHAAKGFRSGPGAWLRLEADALGPRVKVLEPNEGATVPAGQEIPLRVLVYDSNLKGLSIKGKDHAFREGDVYVLIDIKRTTPESGSLTLNLSAVDEAGNTTTKQLEWEVK